tara:strand:+ start:153 stop:806 length:654 start_codon:yes stop_codon:yes gene_type:complete
MAIHKIDGVDGVNNFPKKFVTLYASEAVTKGDFVGVDLSDTTNGLGASVRPLDVADGLSGSTLVLGVATETVSATTNVQIQTAGKFENANVAATVAAGDKLFATTTSGRAADQAAALADIQIVLVDGAAADTNIAITGIQTHDDIVFCFESATSTAVFTDRTSTTSITSDGNIQCTVDTSSDKLLVGIQRQSIPVATALEAASSNAADVLILDQGYF